MPSFSVCRDEGFFVFGSNPPHPRAGRTENGFPIPALVSQPKPVLSRTGPLKDQLMKQIGHLLLALAGILATNSSRAATLSETFAVDPAQNGWKVFGDTNLFGWNATNQHLSVTWDSTRTNSYFYQPLGTILARDDDFSIEFDLLLNDITSGTEPGKTGPMQIALGFQNFAGATHTNFSRGSFGGAPNVAEFNYFTAGYYDFGGIFPVAPTTTPAFISSGGFDYAPSAFTPYEFEIPTNVLVHIAMTFTASNQTMRMNLSTNSVLMVQLPDLSLTNGAASGFSDTDDFRVDTFSIISYSSYGNDYDSILAHGFVDNVVVTVPPSPVQDLTGILNNGLWQVEFVGRTNWIYTLERTVDFASWTEVSPSVAGTAGSQSLTDNAAPDEQAFYRVRANRP
jgi:hypothetical protein